MRPDVDREAWRNFTAPKAAQEETRYLTRAAALDPFDGRVIRGTPIVFNSLSEDLGGFRERILPSAFKRTQREGRDVLALLEHDINRVMGRLSAGTLTMRSESDAVHIKIDPPDTSFARDVMISIGRGDISGMSFRMLVLEDSWHLEQGIPIREVRDMVVPEFSIVAMPAYSATDVEVAKRSLGRFRSEFLPSVEMRARMLRQSMV